jgi:hypothetical protein
MTTHGPTAMTELHSRMNDGIQVRMLWREPDNGVFVAVQDTRNGHSFLLAVREGEKALDVFHHPYAYAAWHGIDTQTPAAAGESAMSLAV